MSAEELKMILDAVSGVSGDAKSVLVLYFTVLVITALLNYLVIPTIGFVIYKVSKYIVSHMSLGSRVAARLGIDSGLPGWDESVMAKIGVLLEGTDERNKG
jgi:hypothetical protein